MNQYQVTAVLFCFCPISKNPREIVCFLWHLSFKLNLLWILVTFLQLFLSNVTSLCSCLLHSLQTTAMLPRLWRGGEELGPVTDIMVLRACTTDQPRMASDDGLNQQARIPSVCRQSLPLSLGKEARGLYELPSSGREPWVLLCKHNAACSSLCAPIRSCSGPPRFCSSEHCCDECVPARTNLCFVALNHSDQVII